MPISDPSLMISIIDEWQDFTPKRNIFMKTIASPLDFKLCNIFYKTWISIWNFKRFYKNESYRILFLLIRSQEKITQIKDMSKFRIPRWLKTKKSLKEKKLNCASVFYFSTFRQRSKKFRGVESTKFNETYTKFYLDIISKRPCKDIIGFHRCPPWSQQNFRFLRVG